MAGLSLYCIADIPDLKQEGVECQPVVADKFKCNSKPTKSVLKGRYQRDQSMPLFASLRNDLKDIFKNKGEEGGEIILTKLVTC